MDHDKLVFCYAGIDNTELALTKLGCRILYQVGVAFSLLAWLMLS